MKTLQEIQIEQRAWSLKNFGEHPSWHPLMGIMEELGELAHAFLKREQGIRGTREEHDAAIKDAIGDVMIYLMDFCSCEGVVTTYVASNHDPREAHAALFALQHQLGSMTADQFADRSDSLGDRATTFVHTLARFCTTQNLDLLTVVNETWDRVSKRDWTKNKVDGGDSVV